MKRHGNLWPQLTSFENLLLAARKAGRRKSRRENVARYMIDIERELIQLQDALRQHEWFPSDFRTFTITKPKPRLISAAPFRDRVVHHALCNILGPIFERGFIHDSYANRVGKGTHAAIARFQEYARRHRYVLKCDVARYFPSIDHPLLKETVRRKIKDRDVLWLVDTIIDHGGSEEEPPFLFPGDDLFTASERGRGLPLGNQTSQFLANVFLDPFDHWVKQQMRAPAYARYVDDFAVFSDDAAWLQEAREACRAKLAERRLKLHPRKAVISRVEDGTRFLGLRVFPDYRLLPRNNVVNMQRRLRQLQQEYSEYRVNRDEIARRIASWLGHAIQANTYRLRKWLFKGVRWRRNPMQKPTRKTDRSYQGNS